MSLADLNASLLRLERTAHTPWGTMGTLYLPYPGVSFPTVEPRWEHNAVGKSCIPAGDYWLKQRNSPMVARTSGGEFKVGWEVMAVKGRSLIMIHPGNWHTDSDGCILVGRAHAVIQNKPGITASRAAFKDLMHRLSARDEWGLSIRWTNPEGV